MFDFLGRLAVTHPWKIVAAWLLIAVGVYLCAPNWESKAIDDDIRFLPERCASVRGYQRLQEAFPHEVFASRVIFALERPDGPLRPKDFVLVDRLATALERLNDDEPELRINKVTSCKDGLIGKRLTSADGRCTLIQVGLETPYLAVQTQQTVDRAEEVLRRCLADAGDDVPQLLTTGAAGVGRDLVRASGDSLENTTLATIALVVIVLLLVYRAPLMVLAPLATIGVSVWVAVHLLALATLLPGVHLVNVSKVFAIVILYGAGTDYCLFLISRYREELEGGSVRAKAIVHTMRAVGGALAASAGTVVCGLSLMGFAEFAKVRCAGPAIAVALAVGLLAALTLTPAILHLFGNAAFWPQGVPGRRSRLRVQGAEIERVSFWEHISRIVVARPLLIWGGAVMMMLPLAIVGLCVSPSYRPTGELSPTAPSIRGMKVIQRSFTAGETGPITVLLTAAADWNTPEGREQIAQVNDAIARMDNVAEVRSLMQPLGRATPSLNTTAVSRLGGLLKGMMPGLGKTMQQADKAAREYYLAEVPGPSGTKFFTRLDVVLGSDPFDPASTTTLEQIEGWLNDQLPASKVAMGTVEADCFGATVHSRDLAQVTDSDRRRVNLLVLGGIFLILLALIRNLWVAGYLLLTTLFSYFVTLGATSMMAAYCYGQPLGQLDWRVPFFLFTILVAVGADYNILLVSRILQERRIYGVNEGTRRGLWRTGGAITACGVIMAGTFATMMLGGLNTLVQIGFALAFGALLDTFVVRPFLVPTFLLLVWRGPGSPKVEEVQEAPPVRRRLSA
ncbi:MAG: MMPL family transporter [Gemmataceae bacterium]|nr:MMPL family transporter [Gemmataceae bacterium]